MTYLPMADAAFAANIPPGFDIAAGYYGGPDAYHVWSGADWDLFPGYKLPIWVSASMSADSGRDEATEAAAALRALSVPEGSFTVLDRETWPDAGFVAAFGAVLASHGYRTWVYASESALAINPPLNGYWVADYTSDLAAIDHLLAMPHVRACQYATEPGFDRSLVRAWTEGEMWHG